MNEKRNILVKLDGFAENERVIFKLIFSVSQRTKNRLYSYELSSAEESDPAAVNIINIPSNSNLQSIVTKKEHINIAVLDHANDSLKIPYLQRPLIATRVLSHLDDLVNNFDAQQSTNSESNDTSHTEKLSEDQLEVSPNIVVSDILDQENLENDQDIHFSISEDEASELAIVHDESLANPANIAEANEALSPEVDENVNHPNDISVEQSNHLVLVSSTNTPAEQQNSELNESVEATAQEVPTALVVDDSASVRKQLEIELNLFDVKVDYAENAQQAFDFLENNNYDVAFLDVVLPDKDGFAICKSIKSSGKETSVIMLTGKATPADKVKGSLAGCDAYLVKPVGRMTFQNEVKNYLPLLDAVKAMGA